jgi:serine/threonine protein kinase
MKVLRKDYIIKKNQIEHTKTERSVLGRAVHHPYIVGLNMAFQTPDKLFLVLDYCPGGEWAAFGALVRALLVRCADNACSLYYLKRRGLEYTCVDTFFCAPP